MNGPDGNEKEKDLAITERTARFVLAERLYSPAG